MRATTTTARFAPGSYLERFLEVAREHEGHQVAEVECFRGRALQGHEIWHLSTWAFGHRSAFKEELCRVEGTWALTASNKHAPPDLTPLPPRSFRSKRGWCYGYHMPVKPQQSTTSQGHIHTQS